MNILIIEDEFPAADRLQTLLAEHAPDMNILQVCDSIESSVEWLTTQGEPDLVFMDIQLADGLSFEIFHQIALSCPVIFTTAYDQYAIRAFQVNSVDYLLKPVDGEALQRALDKHKRLHQEKVSPAQDLQFLLNSLQKPDFQKRFLVKSGDILRYVPVEEVAYFEAESGLVILVSTSGRRFAIDLKLETLEERVDPERFFRLNRTFLAQIHSITKIHQYFNSRLKIQLTPESDKDTFVSREKATQFKKWLNQ